jgi:hypothetical protein
MSVVGVVLKVDLGRDNSVDRRASVTTPEPNSDGLLVLAAFHVDLLLCGAQQVTSGDLVS